MQTTYQTHRPNGARVLSGAESGSASDKLARVSNGSGGRGGPTKTGRSRGILIPMQDIHLRQRGCAASGYLEQHCAHVCTMQLRKSRQKTFVGLRHPAPVPRPSVWTQG